MPVPTVFITDERLDDWKAKLRQSNATPLALIGVGHDHKSGELVVCIPENIDGRYIADILLGVARKLKAGGGA